jgi:uncharacterized protein with GYD domain
MPTYIQLLTLTPEGRARTLEDPEHIIKAQNSVSINGIAVLGTYGVLGRFDFVSIVEAPDEGVVARYSLELGVKCGVHIETLPAIPIGKFEDRKESDLSPTETSRAMPLEGSGRG